MTRVWPMRGQELLIRDIQQTHNISTKISRRLKYKVKWVTSNITLSLTFEDKFGSKLIFRTPYKIELRLFE